MVVLGAACGSDFLLVRSSKNSFKILKRTRRIKSSKLSEEIINQVKLAIVIVLLDFADRHWNLLSKRNARSWISNSYKVTSFKPFQFPFP